MSAAHSSTTPVPANPLAASVDDEMLLSRFSTLPREVVALITCSLPLSGLTGDSVLSHHATSQTTAKQRLMTLSSFITAKPWVAPAMPPPTCDYGSIPAHEYQHVQVGFDPTNINRQLETIMSDHPNAQFLPSSLGSISYVSVSTEEAKDTAQWRDVDINVGVPHLPHWLTKPYISENGPVFTCVVDQSDQCRRTLLPSGEIDYVLALSTVLETLEMWPEEPRHTTYPVPIFNPPPKPTGKPTILDIPQVYIGYELDKCFSDSIIQAIADKISAEPTAVLTLTTIITSAVRCSNTAMVDIVMNIISVLTMPKLVDALSSVLQILCTKISGANIAGFVDGGNIETVQVLPIHIRTFSYMFSRIEQMLISTGKASITSCDYAITQYFCTALDDPRRTSRLFNEAFARNLAFVALAHDSPNVMLALIARAARFYSAQEYKAPNTAVDNKPYAPAYDMICAHRMGAVRCKTAILDNFEKDHLQLFAKDLGTSKNALVGHLCQPTVSMAQCLVEEMINWLSPTMSNKCNFYDEYANMLLSSPLNGEQVNRLIVACLEARHSCNSFLVLELLYRNGYLTTFLDNLDQSAHPFIGHLQQHGELTGRPDVRNIFIGGLVNYYQPRTAVGDKHKVEAGANGAHIIKLKPAKRERILYLLNHHSQGHYQSAPCDPALVEESIKAEAPPRPNYVCLPDPSTDYGTLLSSSRYPVYPPSSGHEMCIQIPQSAGVYPPSTAQCCPVLSSSGEHLYTTTTPGQPMVVSASGVVDSPVGGDQLVGVPDDIPILMSTSDRHSMLAPSTRLSGAEPLVSSDTAAAGPEFIADAAEFATTVRDPIVIGVELPGGDTRYTNFTMQHDSEARWTAVHSDVHDTIFQPMAPDFWAPQYMYTPRDLVEELITDDCPIQVLPSVLRLEPNTAYRITLPSAAPRRFHYMGAGTLMSTRIDEAPGGASMFASTMVQDKSGESILLNGTTQLVTVEMSLKGDPSYRTLDVPLMY